MSENMIPISKEQQQRPVLPAGTYGVQEEAELQQVRVSGEPGKGLVDDDGNVVCPWDKSKPAVQFTVVVKGPRDENGDPIPGLGFVTLDDFIERPMGPSENASALARRFRDLGASDEQIEQGFDLSLLNKTDVVVVVTQKADKNGVPRNYVRRIVAKHLWDQG